jgi:hypothetical protein
MSLVSHVYSAPQSNPSPYLETLFQLHYNLVAPVPSVGPALGCWVKEGLGLVVHRLSGCVAKINTPWPWPWPCTLMGCVLPVNVSVKCRLTWCCCAWAIHWEHVYYCKTVFLSCRCRIRRWKNCPVTVTVWDRGCGVREYGKYICLRIRYCTHTHKPASISPATESRHRHVRCPRPRSRSRSRYIYFSNASWRNMNNLVTGTDYLF